MAKDVQFLADSIRNIKDGFKRANALAAVQMAQRAELLAKKNIIKNFTGRHGYTLTGRLLNSVFWVLDKKGNKGFPQILFGTRGIPYGEIHEFGGEITPKKAQNLWIKNHRAPKQFKRMSPTEFMAAKASKPSQYLILNQTAFFRDAPAKVALRNTALKGVKTSSAQWFALFFLVKHVTIPARPYLRPAIKEASKMYGPTVERNWARIIRGG